jgi:smad nuclear-interacting protein 1
MSEGRQPRRPPSLSASPGPPRRARERSRSRDRARYARPKGDDKPGRSRSRSRERERAANRSARGDTDSYQPAGRRRDRARSRSRSELRSARRPEYKMTAPPRPESLKRRRPSPSPSRSPHIGRRGDRGDRLDSRSASPPRKRRDRNLSRSASPPRPQRDSRSPLPPPRRRRRDSDSLSPRPRRRRSPPRSRSPPPRKARPARSPPPRSPPPRDRKPLPSQEVSFRGGEPLKEGEEPPVEKEKPNFGNTGLLAKESNTISVGRNTSIVLKYNEPPEARKPPTSQPWRLYVFKGAETLKTIQLWTESCWLVGREPTVADLLVEHPSCSKQHAVIQFRHSVKVNEFGDRKPQVRPYLIDLDSANGTKLNGEKITGSRYVEVKDKDVVQFGLSEREYVFMLPPP